MARYSSNRSLLRRAGPPAALLIVGAFFGGYAFLGPNGAFAYGDIREQLARRQGQLAVLERQRDELRNRVALLDPRHVDPDMADELARQRLNVIRSDEVIVPLN